MSRYATPGVQFGPGGISPAVRALIIANVVAYLLTIALPGFMVDWFGLSPQLIFEQGRVWQLATYLFIHDPYGFTHILFNMLALWMFGVDLERRWGTVAFAKYYAVSGIGAGAATVLASLLPFATTRSMYAVPTVGASGAIYGLLLAWALLFPYRRILFMFIFPLPARAAALIMGAMAFMAALSGRNTGVAEATHLAGMLAGWLYLKGPTNLQLDFKYRLTRWRMERLRRRFGIHKGGRDDDWEKRIH